ncbi:hypothetical protein P7K49_018255 [Saguinus oedipus]|uniref:Uncharacterized protein n=1 Tax=Saguinus oedipus TaxID=9490 RepID=A0ABQ9V4X5_SAGOE|nr:hypothetical protein P7K49_018255 [Saguinus oedipus]
MLNNKLPQDVKHDDIVSQKTVNDHLVILAFTKTEDDADHNWPQNHNKIVDAVYLIKLKQFGLLCVSGETSPDRTALDNYKTKIIYTAATTEETTPGAVKNGIYKGKECSLAEPSPSHGSLDSGPKANSKSQSGKL